MNSHLSQISVTTVTFIREMEDASFDEDWTRDQLLAHYEAAVLDEVGGLLGFQVLRVVDTLAWSEALEATDDAANGKTIDFWDGEYRVEQVRICVQIVGDVAEQLRKHADNAEITNGYQLGNTARLCPAVAIHDSTDAAGDHDTCLAA
jgi:hypothetical protein